MDAPAQRMNCGYRLAVWLTQWRRDGKSESKTYLWFALRGRYTRNESETSMDVVATCRAAIFALQILPALRDMAKCSEPRMSGHTGDRLLPVDVRTFVSSGRRAETGRERTLPVVFAH
jgi:hypothetical protein